MSEGNLSVFCQSGKGPQALIYPKKKQLLGMAGTKVANLLLMDFIFTLSKLALYQMVQGQANFKRPEK
jgi:hypothetical protein